MYVSVYQTQSVSQVRVAVLVVAEQHGNSSTIDHSDSASQWYCASCGAAQLTARWHTASYLAAQALC
jgi:hypothetical protein